MSSLSYICGYGSDSEDSDSQENLTKRKKLPVPDLSKVRVVPSDVHVDDPKLHGCRKRSFPHIRGNWATFVYLIYPTDDDLFLLIKTIQQKVSNQGNTWNKCDDLHISLSKTVVLNYHCISPFNISLQKAFTGIESFDLEFGAVKVLSNEDNSRTFIALELDHCNYKYLLSITKKVDEVLSEFNLATFYEKPSFHMSILWTNGNKKNDILNILDNLNNVLNDFGNTLKSTCIDKIHCRSGNKYFQYFLEQHGCI